MRIGIDFTAAVRQQAGIGRYTRSLVRALAELDQSTAYVLLSAGRDPDPAPWPENFERRELPLTDRHLSILWQKLRIPLPVEVFTGGISLFHSPDFVLPPVLCGRTALTIHDLSFLRLPECSSPGLLAYLNDAVPRSIKRADLLLADSESTLNDLVALMGVDLGRIRVVYPAVDSTFRPADHQEIARMRERHALQGPYILSLGTLQPRKNYVRLIQAYHRLRMEQHIPHSLVIGGGPGWLDQPIYDTIAELDLQEHVRLLGFVDEADLPALYSGAEVFAFPTLYEGFGIPVLEAMACGTPVVCSNTSSLPEAAGDAGLLFEPTDTDALADALLRGISDSALRARLISSGYAQATRYTWKESAQRLHAAYLELA
ncbi:MAG: glycosyltransferase family 4 protein [Anaerolineae bacterium]|jgi:glycosyltransferase involved in cell wall biosynthesis|nr:glycosyltransferase family 4 protein [Chloroflexota bacterium]